MSLEQFVESTLQEAPLRLTGFTLNNSTPTTIANLPAMEDISTYNLRDPTSTHSASQLKYQQSQIYIIKEEKAHIITFNTLHELYDSNQPIKERVSKSYKIVIPSSWSRFYYQF